MIYQYKGDYDAALAQYQHSLEIKGKIGDISGMAISMGQMGKLYLEQNQCDIALKIFLSTLSFFKKIGSPNANLVKHNIALCRKKMTEEPFKIIWNAECRMLNDESKQKPAHEFYELTRILSST